MVPLLTLGIPGSGATAVILGAFLLHGMQPGPQVFIKNADLVNTMFASLFLGVIGMCLLGYFAIKLLIKVLYLPEAVTSAFVVLFCFIGAFAARNNITDLWMIVTFGIVGYLFEKYKFPIAPMVLGCILGHAGGKRVHDLDAQLPERNDGLLHAPDSGLYDAARRGLALLSAGAPHPPPGKCARRTSTAAG